MIWAVVGVVLLCGALGVPAMVVGDMADIGWLFRAGMAAALVFVGAVTLAAMAGCVALIWYAVAPW